MVINVKMTENFLILNCIGENDKIGLKFNNKFYVHEIVHKTNNNDKLVMNILNIMKKHKAIFDKSFSILINNGPGSFSSIRVSLAVAKGIKYQIKSIYLVTKMMISVNLALQILSF